MATLILLASFFSFLLLVSLKILCCRYECLSLYIRISALAAIIFDQSSNHQAFKKNALIASKMPLNKKPASKDRTEWFKTAWFYNGDHEKQWQPLYFSEWTVGPKGRKERYYFKGVKKVCTYITECWSNRLVLIVCVLHRSLKSVVSGLQRALI